MENTCIRWSFSCRAHFSVCSNWIGRKSLTGDGYEERDCWGLKLKFPILSPKLLNKSDLWLKHIRSIKVWGLAVAVLFILQTSGWEIGQIILLCSLSPLFLSSEAREILKGIRAILSFTFWSMLSRQRLNNG